MAAHVKNVKQDPSAAATLPTTTSKLKQLQTSHACTAALQDNKYEASHLTTAQVAPD
jgi:hypothetical protein